MVPWGVLLPPFFGTLLLLSVEWGCRCGSRFVSSRTIVLRVCLVLSLPVSSVVVFLRGCEVVLLLGIRHIHRRIRTRSILLLVVLRMSVVFLLFLSCIFRTAVLRIGLGLFVLSDLRISAIVVLRAPLDLFSFLVP